MATLKRKGPSEKAAFKQKMDDAASGIALSLAVEVVNNYMRAHPDKRILVAKDRTIWIASEVGDGRTDGS